MKEKEAVLKRVEQVTQQKVNKLVDDTTSDADFIKNLLDLCSLNKLADAIKGKE